MTAARMVSSCRNERFPYLLSLLKDAGFNIPDVERPIPAPTPDKFDYNRLTNSEFADMLAHLLAETCVEGSHYGNALGGWVSGGD